MGHTLYCESPRDPQHYFSLGNVCAVLKLRVHFFFSSPTHQTLCFSFKAEIFLVKITYPTSISWVLSWGSIWSLQEDVVCLTGSDGALSQAGSPQSPTLPYIDVSLCVLLNRGCTCDVENSHTNKCLLDDIMDNIFNKICKKTQMC